MSKPPTRQPNRVDPGVAARKVAIDALVRIERDDAYANLALNAILERSGLDTRDRGFVTELVYGTTRMRRACDWLIDRFVTREPDAPTRAALRLGAYQLVHLAMAPHAAVGATAGAVPPKTRGFVNAVLRRVAEAGPPAEWPSEGIRLSYPDWIVDWAARELGDGATPTLEHLNRAPEVSERDDGYVQDRASRWVAEAVDAGPGERIADLCAAPGGKATWMATDGGWVAAGDSQFARAGLVQSNVRRLELEPSVGVFVADGRRPPFRPDTFDRVLVDAPCSGLGVLRRRPDARWRIQPDDITSLAALQRELLDSAIPLVRPGGRLVYAVCTLTDAETLDIDRYLQAAHPNLVALDPPRDPWQPHGRGAWLLPQWADTDGMFVLVLERT